MKVKLVGDWATGLAFSVLFLFSALAVAPGFFYGLETSVYDRFMRLSFRQPNDDIAVIGIDDRSIENIGRWPWSRDILAELVDRLDEGGARVIASTIFMGEPEIDPGYDTLRDLESFFRESSLAAFAAAPPADAVNVAEDLVRLNARLAEAIEVLDYDARLAASLTRAGSTVLPMGVELGAPLGRPAGPLPDYVQDDRLTVLTRAPGLSPVEVRRIYPPVSTIGEQALALGHLSLQLDADGAVRFEPLVVRYYEDLYPSLALATAALSLNIPPGDIEVIPGEGVRIGRLHIETTADLRMYNYYYPARAGETPFPIDSFYDVFTGLIPADKFRDKIVLIGAAANGLGDWLNTPVDTAAPPVTVLAHTLSALLEQHFYVRPAWAPTAEAAIVILLVLYLMFGLPRMRAGLAALCSLAICVSLLGAEFVAMNSYFSWLQLTLAVLLVALGHLVVTVKRFRVIERLKQRADAEGAESNKMLGLAFQSQGQLDMAFDKFRRCPIDAGMLDVLYNLALDFERKRQFSKAGAAYQHIAEHDIAYRDVKSRLQRSRDLEDTVMLGAPVSTAGSLATETGLAKPQLGRYSIEREIGRGAMGTVYQGRDPKINRVVAIKTIALSHEFELEELQAVKERFFREAESAGRLKHPDIVTVYDAGEEHDLAYIAMEFLTGTHLNDYVATDKLMPAVQVLTLGARVADALDYAHEQGIVHRDIKPANIMFNPATDEMKLTDFGIARITDSSRTKTGIVLGTPSYMAPEQLSGKNVTGRSDLFSLGVTLYQLLTGLLPFRADSMAALMYKIASEAHAPLGAIRPDLPDCVGQVIDAALEKDPERRVARGSVLARELRTCCEVLVKDKVTI